MEIADVRGFAMSSPIDPVQHRAFHGGVRHLRKRDVVLVVVETRDGTRGVATAGATSSEMQEYFEGNTQDTFADVINGPVAQTLESTTVESASDATDRLHGMAVPDRLRIEARSAVDVAVYDIQGRKSGTPIYELLAEEFETDPDTDLPLYASAGMYMRPERYAEQAGVLADLGFFGYKYRPGIGPEGDRMTVDLVSDTLSDTEFMLDTHTWWKLRPPYGRATIEELVNHASAKGAYWIEEPVAPDDTEGYVSLARTGAALAGGESERSPAGLIDLAKTGAVDFLQGDVRHHGGYTGCGRVVEFCHGRDVEFVPHNFGTWLGLVANAHLVAAAPETSLLEYPVFEDDPLFDADPDPGMYPFELAFDIVRDQPTVTDGRLSVPDGPGLGVTVDLDVIEEYPFIDGPWTEFDYAK